MPPHPQKNTTFAPILNTDTPHTPTPRTGLVLEGGGMRALFSEGFIDVMQQHGLRTDGIIGVSAGALFGCNLKSHQPGRALRYNLRFAGDARYMGLRSLLTTGNYVNARFAYHTVPLQLDPFDSDAFRRDPAEFRLVCTDIRTGQPVCHRIDTVDDQALEWFRATGSMPVVARPVRIGSQLLLDGGLTDCIPLARSQQLGFARNIVILTRPLGYRKTPTRLTPLFRLFHPLHPQVARLMARRHLMYNAQLDYVARQAALGHTLVVRPDQPLRIGRTELSPDKLRAIYQAGREKAEALLPRLRQFLAGSPAPSEE